MNCELFIEQIYELKEEEGGDSMRMSNLYMPTLREVPAEAEIPSHK